MLAFQLPGVQLLLHPSRARGDAKGLFPVHDMQAAIERLATDAE